MGGISSDMVKALGLPVFSHSASTSSWARASMASATCGSSARLRSDGGVVPFHPPNAPWAAKVTVDVGGARVGHGGEDLTRRGVHDIHRGSALSAVSAYFPPTKF